MVPTQVSIITPAFNAERYLEDTIRSVIAQSYTGWELLIVDDCSCDTTPDIAEKYSQIDPRVKLLRSSSNVGIGKARNIGIRAASGRFIAFLDSDDLWMPNKLEQQISYMLANNHPFTHTSYQIINECGQLINEFHPPTKLAYNDLLKACSIGCLTTIYDVSYFGKQFMPGLRTKEDLGMWLKLLKKVKYAYALDTPLAKYRIHANAISRSKINAAYSQWRFYREHVDLGIPRSLYYFTHYTAKGLKKYK